MPKKRSFFERLTGAINADDDQDFFEDLPEPPRPGRPTVRRESHDETPVTMNTPPADDFANETEEDAQLTVDMYQTPDDIIIRTIVAGVSPSDLNVTITREMVTISGRREESHEIVEEDFFHRELYWGGFSRTILLPEEVDVEAAEAVEKHGMLTLRLPKIDKQRETRLSVKAG